MAYVQEPEKDDQEEQKAKYDALLGGGEAPAVGAAPSATPTPAPKTSTGFGFVSSDRYLNANRDTVNRMNTEAKSELAGKADKALAGLGTAKTEITTGAAANTLQGPQANTGINASDVQATALGNGIVSQKAPQYSGPQVSRDHAQGQVNANYAGPTVNDVNSRFGALFADYGDVKEDADTAARHGVGAVKKWNGFDSMLSNAAGGRDVRDVQKKVGEFSNQFTDARKAAEAAVTAGVNSHDESLGDSAAGKWDALIGGYDAEQTRKATEATERAETIANDQWNLARAPLMGDRVTPGVKGRPTGEEIMHSFNISPLSVAFNPAYRSILNDSPKWQAAMDKMSDADLKRTMQMLQPLNGGYTAGTAMQLPAVIQYMTAMMNKYGVK